MNMKNAVRLLINAVVAISLCGFVLSCGGGGDSDSGGGAGQSGTVTLSVANNSLPADGSSSTTVHAVIKDSSGGAVRHYTEVVFTTTLGHFRNGSTRYTMTTQPPLGADGFPNPDAPPTGIADVQFIAGTTPGAAKITVTSNGVTNTIYVSLAGVSGAIVLYASPTSISADGSSSSIITATLTDSGGNPVKPGTPVSFMTGLGYFENGGKTYSLTTPDSTGVVQVSLHAGVVPGITYVVATSKGITQSISIVFTDTGASEMSIAANPSSIPADGISTSVVTATVKNVAGTPIKDVPVTFYDVTGTGQPPDPLPPDNTYTGTGDDVTSVFYNNGGNIEFTMTDNGPYWLQVLLYDYDKLKLVAVLADSVAPVVGLIKTVSLPIGSYFLEVRSGGTWSIKVDGAISPTPIPGAKIVAITQTDINGKAEYVYTSTLKAGFIWIKAETGQVSNSEEGLSKTVEITQTAGAPTQIELTASPEKIYANGASTSTITAMVSDAYGNPVEDGTIVTFSATRGTIGASAQTVGGIASTTLTSVSSISTLSSTITGSVNGLSNSTSVTFLGTGGVSLADMSADPSVILANGTSTSTISVRLQDASGVGIPNETITFSTTSGTLQSSEAKTDGTGLATTTLISATTSGTATVTAQYGAMTANTTVNFTGGGGAVASITVTATPSTVPADGTSTSDIRAAVKNIQGDPVADGEVISFTITSGTGTLSATSAPTVGGFVTIIYTASKTPGAVTIQAMAANFIFSTTTLTLTSGGVGSITLTASPTSIPANGSSSSTVTATLTDSSGGAVPAGTSVTFTTDLGTFAGGGMSVTVPTPNASGAVSVSLISASTAGSATVIATSGGVSQSVNVTFSGSGIVATINLTANPNTLPADGTSTSVLRADVRDGSNNPVPDGTSISFVILTGTGTLSANTGTTVGGFVEVTYTASTTAGTETVRAMSENFVSANADITLTSAGVGTIALVANPNTLPADGTSSAAITASVQDGSGNPIAKGTAVTFTTTLGTFTGGGTSITVNTLDDTGTIAVSLISATTPGTATITAASGGVTQATTVTFAGGGQPASLSLGTSQATVKSDNSDSATITATLLDGNNAPISGYTVAFSTTTGIISSSSATTNASGQAVVTFSSGTTDPTNRTALVTATVVGPSGNITANIPVEILGSTLTLSTDKTTIPSDGSITATLTATAREGGGTPVAGAVITFTVTGLGGATVTPTSGTNNTSGQVQVTVTGTANGDATVTADWNGTTAAQGYTVSAAVDTFRIQQPSADPYSTRTSASTGAITVTFSDTNPDTITQASVDFTTLGFQAGDGIVVSGSTSNDGVYTVGTVTATTLTLVAGDSLTAEGPTANVTIISGVMVEVYAPGTIANVSFTTTIGTWDDTGSPIITKAVPGSDIVKAVLVSTLAGTATVQAYDADNISTSDTTTISFSVPSGDAAQISLQASVYTVPPSVGGNKNTATLTATVRTDVAAGGQVVSGVAVSFSIVNPTGGGEYVVPVVVITNAAGQAQATFTSGALSTGAEGVTIRASVVDNTTITDTIAIVIGGTAGSVVIGRGTVIYDVNDATYRLPMAALVTDSNGNAISGAVVTLSTWPISYSSGVWYDQDPDPNTDYFVPYITGTWPNEDVNENLILDPGEDLDGNGQLTPPNSSAGGVAVPSEVVTDENGVAEFDLYYLKAAAVWIVTRVRAQTVVVGTETTSSIHLRLPAEEQQAKDGLLPDSAYPIGLVTGATTNVSYTFPTFLGTGDVFSTLTNLSAGTSSMSGGPPAYVYTYVPTGGTAAVVGDWVWDYITVTNSTWFVGAYFPVRIIIQ